MSPLDSDPEVHRLLLVLILVGLLVLAVMLGGTLLARIL